MISSELLEKVRRIEIRTKRLLHGTQVGDYHSRQRGYGLEFDQLRNYELGDDVRFIDWKASARMNDLLVKQYIHEFNKTILIALDVSESTVFGSDGALKSEIIAQIATVLTFVGHYAKARVGLILFSDIIELSIAPKNGMKHVQLILEKLWNFKSSSRKTSIKVGLRYLASMAHKDTISFIVSDFIDHGFERDLNIFAKRYELIAIRCLDAKEKELSFNGFIHAFDPEYQEEILLDMRGNSYKSLLHQRLYEQNRLFCNYGVDYVDVLPNAEFIDTLVGFFAKRIR